MTATQEDNRPEVFVSVGRSCCPEQERTIGRIFDFIHQNGLSSLSSSTHAKGWPSAGTMPTLREVLGRASGTIVLAFERKVIVEGTELRQPFDSKAIPVILPTPWNQAEIGMAWAVGHPILVLMDRKICKEGLLDVNFPWHIEWIDPETFDPYSISFQQAFAKFMKDVREKQTKPPPIVVKQPPKGGEVTVVDLLKAFTLKEAFLLLGGVGTVFMAGHLLGRLFLPWP